MDKLEPISKDILKENIEKIKNLFPEVFSEDKVDFERLKEVLGDFKEENEERYSFNWNGKAQAKRIAQTPTSATLKPNKKESEDWDKTQNLYIEGDNLEVLKILQTPYYGKVKMIYIDPPYNTGKDFVYKDNFKDSLKNYLEQTGQIDNEGNKTSTNTEQNGRYHTDWLNMMYPRLTLARNLLREDGVIFISIDDHEVHNLRKICDEVFGEENFVAEFIWNKKTGRQNDARFVSNNTEYIICYLKNVHSGCFNLIPRTEESDRDYKNPDNDPRGLWTTTKLDAKSGSVNSCKKYEFPNGVIWNPTPGRFCAYSKETLNRLYEENRIWFGEDGKNVPRVKRFLSEVKQGLVPNTLLLPKEVGNSQKAKEDYRNVMGDVNFDNPKPLGLIKFLNILGSQKDSLILDFFSGSATTAHAVMQLNAEDGGNRRYIMVQLPEKIKEDSEAHKAGYKNICEIGKERIRRAGEKIKKELEEKNKQLKLGKEPLDLSKLDFGFKVFKLVESNLESSIIDPNQSEEQIKEKIQASLDVVKQGATEEDLLYEILLKYKIELTEPIIEENVLGKKVYVLGEGLLFICLDKELTKDIGGAIGKLKEKYDPEDEVRVVFRDSGFKTSKEKLNVIHTLKNYGIIDVKSI